MRWRRMKWAGRVARLGDNINADKVLVGKPEGTRSVERPWLESDDNSKVNLKARVWVVLN
jgi:hypothetical protein